MQIPNYLFDRNGIYCDVGVSLRYSDFFQFFDIRIGRKPSWNCPATHNVAMFQQYARNRDKNKNHAHNDAQPPKISKSKTMRFTPDFHPINSTSIFWGITPASKPRSNNRCTAFLPRSVQSTVHSLTYIPTNRSAKSRESPPAYFIA